VCEVCAVIDVKTSIPRDIPPMGSKFHTAAQTGPQATTPLVTAPYQSTVYLRFEPVTATAEK
jgi:hypothetical protein